MIRSAPSRRAASTPHRPTAPSPTTATVPPGPTPGAQRGVVAGAADVGERSERRGQAAVGEVDLVGQLHQRAVGERHAHRLALAAVVAAGPRSRRCAQEVCRPSRQNSQIPSDQANGATTRSPGFSVRDLGADGLDDAEELVARSRPCSP